jgi:hypothetical protein
MIQTGLFFKASGAAEAIYTPSAEERPAWYSFPLKIEVSGERKKKLQS